MTIMKQRQLIRLPMIKGQRRPSRSIKRIVQRIARVDRMLLTPWYFKASCVEIFKVA